MSKPIKYKPKTLKPKTFQSEKIKIMKTYEVKASRITGANENIKSNYNENCMQQKKLRCGKYTYKT